MAAAICLCRMLTEQQGLGRPMAMRPCGCGCQRKPCWACRARERGSACWLPAAAPGRMRHATAPGRGCARVPAAPQFALGRGLGHAHVPWARGRSLCPNPRGRFQSGDGAGHSSELCVAVGCGLSVCRPSAAAHRSCAVRCAPGASRPGGSPLLRARVAACRPIVLIERIPMRTAQRVRIPRRRGPRPCGGATQVQIQAFARATCTACAPLIALTRILRRSWLCWRGGLSWLMQLRRLRVRGLQTQGGHRPINSGRVRVLPR